MGFHIAVKEQDVDIWQILSLHITWRTTFVRSIWCLVITKFVLTTLSLHLAVRVCMRTPTLLPSDSAFVFTACACLSVYLLEHQLWNSF